MGAPGGWRRLEQRLHEPVDASSLGAFRITFGLLLAYEVWALWPIRSWAFIDPPVHFSYEAVAFAAPLSSAFVHAALLGTCVAAIAVAVGFCYRLSAAALFIGFGCVFFFEEALYLNHFYLILLLAGLLCVLHADRWAAVDNLWRRGPRPTTVPCWNVMILRWQLVIVYFFGGVAKLNGDWLRGEPLTAWLARRQAFPFFGDWLADPTVALWFFSYGGLLFDLSIGFLLLSRKTRDLALIPLLFFHVTNALVFNIGVFPWLMLAATVVFFEPDAPRRWIAGLRGPSLDGEESPNQEPPATHAAQPTPSTPGWRRRVATGFFVAWIAVQATVPLRHWLYPGDVNWTEEGHRFSWRMKLRDKRGWLTFAVTDPRTGRTVPLTPAEGYAPPGLQLNRKQLMRMTLSPRLTVQYAHHLHRHADLLGMEDPEVRVVSVVSLNGRPHQLLIDPDVDLAKVETPWLAPGSWIVPLAPNQPIGLYEPVDLSRFEEVLIRRFPDNPFWERYEATGDTSDGGSPGSVAAP